MDDWIMSEIGLVLCVAGLFFAYCAVAVLWRYLIRFRPFQAVERFLSGFDYDRTCELHGHPAYYSSILERYVCKDCLYIDVQRQVK